MAKAKLFATEADLVAAFCDCLGVKSLNNGWTAYHETAGWDLLLAHETGAQIGIEAKLSLNPKVLDQALPGRWAEAQGPDFRAVLVPYDGHQHHMASIARHVGVVVIYVQQRERYSIHSPKGYSFYPHLPDPGGSTIFGLGDWPNWCPAQRCKLPDYVPDVTGGHAAPVALTDWKIKAIKLLILLERRGFVTRADMKALEISPTRWTDHYSGFLGVGPDGGYIRNGRTPDLKAQHPTNWAQIEADFETWSKGLPGTLFGAAA